ncbi:MAG: response regulator transcription factor [Halobacteriales archaeon]
MSDAGTVLVVDDETLLADLFASWLESDWDVRVAYDGESALEALDESVSVVLLDRRMPGLSGDEVLHRIRDAGYDCRVVMVTAVDPDFDIVEMGFDDYIVKPISKEDLQGTVATVADRAEYDADIQELYALASKKALLEAEKSERDLRESEEYEKLNRRFTELRQKVDELREDLFEGHDDFVGAFERLEDG